MHMLSSTNSKHKYYGFNISVASRNYSEYVWLIPFFSHFCTAKSGKASPLSDRCSGSRLVSWQELTGEHVALVLQVIQSRIDVDK
jgi:hypothetical protein